MVSLVGSTLVQEELLKLQLAAIAAEGGSNINGFIDELGNIKLALAKLPKTVPAHNNGHATWESWDVLARDMEVTRTGDDEVFAHATHSLGNNLRLGRTLTGCDFFIEGQALEKVNVVTAVKGGGKQPCQPCANDENIGV
jgi:hypothetical protein